MGKAASTAQQGTARDRRVNASFEGRATAAEADAILRSGATLSKYDVARIFGWHPDTVVRKAREGKLPARQNGRTWIFYSKAIQSYMDGRC